MRSPPLSVVATWPAPNYVNPETRGPVNLIVISILLGFVTVLLALRVYTRLKISKGFGMDDVLILAAYVPATAFAIAGLDGEVRYQRNRHTWDVEPDLFTPSLQLGLASQILFSVATNLTKLSMLSLIYRVIAATNSRMRYAAIGLAVVVACDSMVFLVVDIFQCRPVSDYWTLSRGPQSCINEAVHLLAAGCINTTIDLLIVLLPIRTVMKLDLPVKERIVLYSLFGGGVFIVLTGAARTYVTWYAFHSPDFDTVWHMSHVTLFSSVELYVGIIVASLPAIKPFFSHWIPRMFGPSPWTRVTEPLQEKRKRRSSLFGDSYVAWDQGPLGRQQHPYGSSLNIQSPTSYMPLYSTVPPSLPGPAHKRSASLPGSPNLNKPLPDIRTSMVLSRILADSEPPRPQNNSLYDFKAYPDGHLSVYRSSRI